MKVLTLPFTKKIGITQATSAEYILQLNYNPDNLNHLNTIHASASYALAETTSGFFLRTNFTDIADQTIPIMHSSTVKYKRGAIGDIFSKANLKGTNVKELSSLLMLKRKAVFIIQVKLFNEANEIIMSGEFEWFVTLK